MSLERIDAKYLPLLGLVLLLSPALGCTTPAVGAPCLPEQVPEDGFNNSEAYIESSSVQCETRVCMVYQLEGDPTRNPTTDPSCNSQKSCDLNDETCIEEVKCAAPNEVEDRIYCTCRCNSGGTGFAECECPDGFSCVEVLEQGGPGVRGGYCVKNGTFFE
ncbi:MAG: hypothetical protein OEZ06_18415 [Myxococcales bacterium]|nr:hypothetical protein [Myxococcales bacterium]